MSFHVPNAYRLRKGPLGSGDELGNNGVFLVPNGFKALPLRVVASDGLGWEHVSVSFAKRTPLWVEMDYIKSVFWDAEDCVMQLHPPRSEWVNCHPHCLHLWRPIGVVIPAPPSMLVGPVTG